MCSCRKTSANRRRPSAPRRCARRGRPPGDPGPRPVPHIARRHEKPGLPVQDHLPGPVHVETDHRLAGDQGLRQRAGKPFPKARMNHDVHGGQQRRNLLRRHQPGEVKMPRRVRPRQSAAPAVPRSTPSPTSRNRTRGWRPDQLLGRVDHIVVALEVKRAARSCRSPRRSGGSPALRRMASRDAGPTPATARPPCRCRSW